MVIRNIDRKHVNLLSTGHNCKLVSTGKRHYQTILSKTRIVHEYNKYMGGVDRNDQLLKYSAFNKRSAKWWKKLLFRSLNVGMVNAYCYKEWLSQHSTRRINQTDFITQCIHQTVNSVDNFGSAKRRSDIVIKRLTERHFIQKIVVAGRKSRISRGCQVCGVAPRQLDEASIKRKRYGKETSYECPQCCVSLCIEPCFSLYHQHKDYIT